MPTMYPAMINSPQTTISSAITNTATTINVVDGNRLPAGPNLATIGTGETAETIMYTGKTGNQLTGVTRGFQGTAQAWPSGTAIARLFTAYDHDSFIANLNKPEYSTQQEATASIISIPSNSAEGQFNATLRGVTRQNLLTLNQSSVETDTTGLFFTGSGSVISRNTTEKYFGDASLRVQTDGSTTNQGFFTSGTKGIAGRNYIGSAYVKAPAGSLLQILLRREGSATLSSVNFTASGGWDRVSTSLLLDVDTTDLRLFVRTQGALAVTFFVDGLMIEEGNTLNSFITGGVPKSTVSAIKLKSVGKNLLDKSKITQGYRISATGTIEVNAEAGLSDFIKIQNVSHIKNKVYNSWADRRAYYDINKNLISYELVYTASFTPPANAVYMRSNLLLVDKDTFQIERGTVSSTYEPYTESISYISSPSGEPWRSLPNGTYDEIRDSGNGTLESVKRVSNDFILNPVDIGVYSTTGINADLVVFNRSLLPNVAEWTTALEGKVSVQGWTEVANTGWDTTANIGKFYTSATQLCFIVAKGTYSSLTNARASFPIQTLTYQLAVPIITKLDGISQIKSFPNGTLYIEPVIRFVGKPSGGVITIPNTSLPIKAIESVQRIDGGNVKVPVTNFTNPTNTTIGNLSDSYFYEVVYEYPSELTTIPKFLYAYPINTAGSIESALRMASANSKQITDFMAYQNAVNLQFDLRLTAGGH